MRTKAIMISTLIFAAALALQANTAEAQRVVTDGLISHWSFDTADVQGDIIKDAWGSNDGTIVGGPNVVEGKVGEALELNGVDQYVDVGHPADGSLDFGQDIDFTIAAWIKVSETPADQYTIVSKGDRGSSARILFKINGDLAYITLANEPGGGQKPDFTSNTPVVDGEWHYVALVADRRNATMIYVDGVLDAEGIGSDATDVNTESPLYIGKSHQDGNDPRRFLEGLIDEVSIYNRALSINEIQQNMVALGIAVEPASKMLAVTWGEMKVLD
jgi:sialidase-1